MASAPSGQGVALQRMLCEVCAAPLSGHQERFCGPAHRWLAWDRAHPRRHPAPVDPAKARRLRRSALRILGRLQTGPATNIELQSVGGLRYGARLHELRQAGHRVTTDEDKRTGVVIYRLLP